MKTPETMSNVTNNTAVEEARAIATKEELSLSRACLGSVGRDSYIINFVGIGSMQSTLQVE